MGKTMNQSQLTGAVTEGINEGGINLTEREEALTLYHQIYTTSEADKNSQSHARPYTLINCAIDKRKEKLLIKSGVEVNRITQADAKVYCSSNDEKEKGEILQRATGLERRLTRNKQMIPDPLVSVIIPVFNVKPYLAEALDSVINQTYEKLEILIVDDGSTDGSGIICDEYAKKDKRISVIHQTNSGLSAARNMGLDRMTGEVCAFLDPDDAYDRKFVEKLQNALLIADADLSVCKYTVHHTTGKLKRDNGPVVPSGASGIYNYSQGLCALADETINVSVWNKLYRRELWCEIRYPDGHMYEDIDTSFRIFDLCNTINVIDEPLYLHRKRPGSITDTISLENIQDRYLACSHFASFIESHIPEIFSQAQSRKWWRAAFNGMIVSYINYTNDKVCDEIAFRKELREKIISIGKVTDIETLGLRTKIAWHILRISPWLLKVIYLGYQPFRLLVYRVFGK